MPPTPVDPTAEKTPGITPETRVRRRAGHVTRHVLLYFLPPSSASGGPTGRWLLAPSLSAPVARRRKLTLSPWHPRVGLVLLSLPRGLDWWRREQGVAAEARGSGRAAGMGNASAKEGENGHMAASPELAAAHNGGGGSSSTGGPAARPPPPPLSPPDAVMLERPPPVPYLFAPQVPVAPLHRPTEFSPVFNHSPTNGTSESTNHHSQEKGIPTLVTWSQGGNEVFLEGSWDNWTSRRALERSGKDHAILLVLPSGVYHYRIIVDGELRYIPELPHATDERGQVANLLDVHVSKDAIFLFRHSNL
ncbi:SNF1-related protein kinase regulatory subunit beta-1 isoform X2 [Sorghum bicolor]|uniref:SNF1-related protein kinase regulatory subunit beta-1 isoform X2 n=1 Tax=Sorghum bicolor TaxID=4558 RepID=UPI00081AD37F|nr:SNF1-related protein kinase regulatory subunit beta-1 isoform X2 [Sorghum bicolor]|eukprot:XP_021303945.1 SNF1-related protein kinase regulatory subunit beta-1 isoform X2 [Sorghum bicolor]